MAAKLHGIKRVSRVLRYVLKLICSDGGSTVNMGKTAERKISQFVISYIF